MITRRATISAGLAFGATAICTPRLARGRAQIFPNRPVRLVVTVSPGGAADATARLIGTKLAATWGQPVVVENRLGATGMIGADLVAKSPADGYTVLFASTSFVQAPALFPDAPYDIKRDFAPVSQVARLSVVLLVGAKSPYRTFHEYLAAARSGQSSVTYGSMGTGSSLHLYGATLAKDAVANLVHVPYKGEAPALVDVVGGHVDSCFASVASATPLIASGQARPLAVVGDKRVRTLPDVPTLVELGFPRLNVLGWYGVLVPAATPQSIVAKLATDFATVMKNAEVVKIIEDGGNSPVGGTSAEFADLLASDFSKWRQIIQEAGVKPPA